MCMHQQSRPQHSSMRCYQLFVQFLPSFMDRMKTSPVYTSPTLHSAKEKQFALIWRPQDRMDRNTRLQGRSTSPKLDQWNPHCTWGKKTCLRCIRRDTFWADYRKCFVWMASFGKPVQDGWIVEHRRKFGYRETRVQQARYATIATCLVISHPSAPC